MSRRRQPVGSVGIWRPSANGPRRNDCCRRHGTDYCAFQTGSIGTARSLRCARPDSASCPLPPRVRFRLASAASCSASPTWRREKLKRPWKRRFRCARSPRSARREWCKVVYVDSASRSLRRCIRPASSAQRRKHLISGAFPSTGCPFWRPQNGRKGPGWQKMA